MRRFDVSRRLHPRLRFGLVWALLFAGSLDFADAQEPKRRVYVLHSGMHIILAPADKNHAARTMQSLLQERGIKADDLVALESPFPTASLQEMVPREGLLLYLDAADPSSSRAQDCYVRMDRALKAQGVTGKDELIWIGHSAGGQIGMSMAHLAHNLSRYPELAARTQPYRFGMVITLGSAVGSNPVPDAVKLRHYHSAGDIMIQLLSKHGDLLAGAVGSSVRFRACCELKDQTKMRVFSGIEHPSWYHEDRVLDCVLREQGASPAPWRRAHADIGCGRGLAQLFAAALENRCKIALEDERP